MKKSSPSDIAKMDSLKIPKGGSSKPPSGSVPITVRFNAGEESLDDIFQSFYNIASGGGGDSLSSSPQQQNQQQQPDEVNTRNNFLQGNFFNRKRSGSIEGPSSTSSAAATISTLSTSESNSVGTWKLIKGKVSQAMEDIKSSKNTNISVSKGDDPDSDQENATINSSISDEFSLEQEFKATSKCDSDSDIEPDILLEGDVERSRIRRSIAHLKSKVKSRSQPSSIPVTKSSLSVNNSNSGSASSAGSTKKDQSPSRVPTLTSTGTSSLRSTFLRKRKKPVVEGAEAALAATNTVTSTATKEKKGIIAGKKEVEIESGVEMLEDMVPAVNEKGASVQSTAESDSKSSSVKHSLELPIESLAKPGEGKINATCLSSGSDNPEAGERNLAESDVPKSETLNPFYVIVKSLPFLVVLLLLIVLCIPSIPDFVRGVFSCLLMMLIFSSAWHYAQQVVVTRVTCNGPEKSSFKLPDFKHMSICEIPAVEEHMTVKTYTGWMNEIHSYDPGNFHVSMTKSVYVKLDGSMLRVSNTTARIPKRQMWNEPLIDRKTITFTRHRTFNLLGCRIEMLPRGLARKRYFSRKYPIQLIIKNCDGQTTEEPGPSGTIKEEKKLKRPSSSKSLDEKVLEGKSNKNTEGKENSLAPAGTPHQNSSESLDDRSERSGLIESENDLDFAATVLNADQLQCLQENAPDFELVEVTVPCGDETRILLFARGDREKEDWYRRFVSASTGDVNDQDLHLPNVVMVSEADIKAAQKAASLLPETIKNKEETTPSKNMTASVVEDPKPNDNSTASDKPDKAAKKRNSTQSQNGRESTPDTELPDGEKLPDTTSPPADETYEGLLISTCAARNPLEYIRFMSRYQNACNQTRIPVFKAPTMTTARLSTRTRREKRQEDELWKGIDQSLFLGPSGSVVWANVLIGRILFSCLNDSLLLGKIQEFLQKKLTSIKLPGFMEDVSITQIFLGDTPPLIHRVSQPVIDERGTWIDADLTYEGLMHMTITTKLNLLRLKRQQTSKVTTTDGPGISASIGTPTMGSSPPQNLSEAEIAASNTDQLIDEVLTNCAIYDSDAESSGASSSEAGSPTVGSIENNSADTQFFNSSPGNARRLFKIVDRIAASNLFQYATELSYVQKAMENMSTNITLRVDLKGLVSRVTINIPPPPSDRIWLAFRGPPRLWISATPTVGDHTFDWSIVTNVIESKLCEEAYKYLVYPNMIDVIVPFLGQSTYKE